ncbi:MAG: hypothetical protein ABSF34_20800 [Verrucomicrobiota bacterium]
MQRILESADIEQGVSRIRRMDMLVNITQHHRTIWLKFFDSPSLERIFMESPDLDKDPVTEDEAMFVQLIMLHLTTILTAVRKGLLPKTADQDADLKAFFRLPIPQITWRRTKILYDPATRRYIDELLKAIDFEAINPKYQN